MTEGLSCECHMQLLWRAVQLGTADLQFLTREATLLLTVLNQMEGMHEAEPGSPENRRLDRIEAKLDLTLHLLAQSLEQSSQGNDKAAISRSVRLTPVGAQWPDPTPPSEGTSLIVEFRPSAALPLSLKLPAIALAPQSGHAQVRFEGLSEGLDEAIYQFIFRRHRQAIRGRAV